MKPKSKSKPLCERFFPENVRKMMHLGMENEMRLCARSG